MKQPPPILVNFRLPAALANELRAVSKKTGISQTRIATDAIRNRLKEMEMVHGFGEMGLPSPAIRQTYTDRVCAMETKTPAPVD